MGMVAILVKWPKTNIISILFYLMNTPYQIWVISEKKVPQS